MVRVLEQEKLKVSITSTTRLKILGVSVGYVLHKSERGQPSAKIAITALMGLTSGVCRHSSTYSREMGHYDQGRLCACSSCTAVDGF